LELQDSFSLTGVRCGRECSVILLMNSGQWGSHEPTGGIGFSVIS